MENEKDFQPGDVVNLKSNPLIKYTIIEIDNGNATCLNSVIVEFIIPIIALEKSKV